MSTAPQWVAIKGTLSKRTILKEKYAKFIDRIHARDFFAECLATFVLVTIGNGAVAQFIFSQGSLSFFSVNAGYAIGLMVGAYMAGGVTGGHMNPAITLAMALRGKTNWIKVIPYWIAQLLGAFIGSIMVYAAYIDLINNFNGRLPNGGLNPNCLTNGTVTPKLPLCTGGIFATYPNENIEIGSAFFNEVLGTFFLALGIFGIIDAGNSEVMSGLKPLMIGLTFWGIGTSFGITTGYAINPARDFSPRLFTAMAGWGKDVFKCSQCSISHYWWIPVVAPFIGAIAATGVYWLLIEVNHPRMEEDTDTAAILTGSAKRMKKTESAIELTEAAA